MSAIMAPEIINYKLPMDILMCWKCGIRFCADRPWIDSCVDRGHGIYCPRGHCNKYVRDTPKDAKNVDKVTAEVDRLKKENERLKRELVQAIHDADQAQARKENTLPTEEMELPNGDPVKEKPTSKAKPSYRCETCGKVYKTAGAFGNHQRDIHNLEVTPEMMKQSQSA